MTRSLAVRTLWRRRHGAPGRTNCRPRSWPGVTRSLPPGAGRPSRRPSASTSLWRRRHRSRSVKPVIDGLDLYRQEPLGRGTLRRRDDQVVWLRISRIPGSQLGFAFARATCPSREPVAPFHPCRRSPIRTHFAVHVGPRGNRPMAGMAPDLRAGGAEDVPANSRCLPHDLVDYGYSVACTPPSGSGSSRGPRIHTSCAVVVAPTSTGRSPRWCFTVECARPRRWAAAFSDPAASTAATTTTSRSVARPAGARRPTRHALRTSSRGTGRLCPRGVALTIRKLSDRYQLGRGYPSRRDQNVGLLFVQCVKSRRIRTVDLLMQPEQFDPCITTIVHAGMGAGGQTGS